MADTEDSAVADQAAALDTTLSYKREGQLRIYSQQKEWQWFLAYLHT